MIIKALKTSFVLMICLASSLIAEEELVVHVSTESSLLPLYLDTFSEEKAGLEPAYIRQLEQILSFDLQNNGRMQLIQKSKECQLQAKKEKRWKVFDNKAWQSLHVDYVVKGNVTEKKLSCAVLMSARNAIKGIDGVTLTGNLGEDRRKVHQIADAIFEACFGEKGICSTRILYTVRKRVGDSSKQWQTDIWEADYDGANAKQITHDGVLCVNPCFLPGRAGANHHAFLYVSYSIGQPKIFLASTQDGKGKRVTLLQGNQLMPVMSPKKDLMAFVSDVTGNPELFVQPFHPEKGPLGKPRQIFSAPQGAQGSPTFDPSGSRIAFVSNKDGAPRIYTMDLPNETANIQKITPTLISKLNRDNTSPAWSPDGKKIAYCALTKGVRQIWFYDLVTKKEIQITEGPGHKENPTWAPNSEHIMFNTATANSSELFLVHIEQKQPRQISKGPGEKRFPSWESFSP